MNTVKEVFEAILSDYRKVTPLSTCFEVGTLGLKYGVCNKLHSILKGDHVKLGIEVELIMYPYLRGRYYYCKCPIYHEHYSSNSVDPVGEYLYSECILPRVLLLGRIIKDLEAA